jgi:hypothetical protein
VSRSGSLIAPATAKPLVDFTERGVLLADTQGPADIRPEVEPVAVEEGGASTAMHSQAPRSVGVALTGSPGPGGSGQATLSHSEAAPPSSVTAKAHNSAPAEIAVHLDRVRKRYVAAPTSATLTERHGRAAAQPAHAQVVASPIGGPQAAESTSSLVVQDNELVAIQLGELISLFEARLDRPLFVWMRSSPAASKFVTAETLAAAGIQANYDSASKQLVLTLPKE